MKIKKKITVHPNRRNLIGLQKKDKLNFSDIELSSSYEDSTSYDNGDYSISFNEVNLIVTKEVLNEFKEILIHVNPFNEFKGFYTYNEDGLRPRIEFYIEISTKEKEVY